MNDPLDSKTLDRIMNMDKVRNVPERIVPGNVETQGLAEHVARYSWAAPRLRGRVLDLGCGVGYGAHLCASLNIAIKQIICVDFSRDALLFAQQAYADRRIVLVQGDACRLPFVTGSFDSVVCFEVIEHVENARALLEEVKRVLRPQGFLLISTPNKLLSSPLLSKPLNPHHRREWYPQQFVTFLRRYFCVDSLHGQNWVSMKRIVPLALNCYKTRFKVSLHRVGLHDLVRMAYRTVFPYRARSLVDKRPVEHVLLDDLVKHKLPSALGLEQPRPRVIPEIVIAVAMRCCYVSVLSDLFRLVLAQTC
jgi:SAM-dependent methyltransferase